MSENWVDALKAGDKVIVRGAGTNQTDAVGMVVRLLPTQVIVNFNGHERRFSRRLRKMHGSSEWSGVYIREASEPELAAVAERARRQRAYNYVRGIEWKRLPTATLEAVAKLVNTTGAIPEDG